MSETQEELMESTEHVGKLERGEICPCCHIEIDPDEKVEIRMCDWCEMQDCIHEIQSYEDTAYSEERFYCTPCVQLRKDAGKIIGKN